MGEEEGDLFEVHDIGGHCEDCPRIARLGYARAARGM